METAGPHPSVSGICISNELPGDTEAASPRTYFGQNHPRLRSHRSDRSENTLTLKVSVHQKASSHTYELCETTYESSSSKCWGVRGARRPPVWCCWGCVTVWRCLSPPVAMCTPSDLVIPLGERAPRKCLCACQEMEKEYSRRRGLYQAKGRNRNDQTSTVGMEA